MSDKMPKIQKYEHQKEKINKDEIIHTFAKGGEERKTS